MFKNLVGILLVALSFAGWAFAQPRAQVIEKVGEIRLLESTRDDVRRILASYKTFEENDHIQLYSGKEVDIRVHFSTGTCSDDPNDGDETSIWEVSEWIAVRIEISFQDEASLKDIGMDVSKWTKEQMYAEQPDMQIYHDKDRGLAVEVNSRQVENVIIFPPEGHSKILCRNNLSQTAFYSRKSWFDQKLKDRHICILVNTPAHVEELNLSLTEISATSGKIIKAKTIAFDPENDVLTYNYKVSGGRIIGSGGAVEWDLTALKAGTYTITVGVDDGAGIVGKTITKAIVIR